MTHIEVHAGPSSTGGVCEETLQLLVFQFMKFMNFSVLSWRSIKYCIYSICLSIYLWKKDLLGLFLLEDSPAKQDLWPASTGFGLFWCLNILLPLPPPLLPPSAKLCHGCKSSLLSSHQSAGISSMPRSLCAAKREIKGTVISSAASAAESCSAAAEWVCEGGAKGCQGKKRWREGWGGEGRGWGSRL